MATAVRILRALILAVLATAAPVAAQDRGALVERGRTAFMANGCHGCHTVGKMDTPIGPDLSRVGFKYREEYLERWLRDPAYLRPSAHMPKLELKESDLKALASYLASLR
ncbi:MAG: c-type cytochrome [Candidatus Rokuibacteriota bacterium]